MGYPYYKYSNQKEFDYIINKLKSFEYDISNDCIYCPLYEFIVINSANIFGKVDTITSNSIGNFNRFLITDLNEFLYKAAKLKGAIFNPNKTKTNMENNKSQTKEPKLGDKVFVKNKINKDFQVRIYIGKIHNKYACVNNYTEKEFHKGETFTVSLWDEITSKITVTKTQIADKFGVSVDMLKIVD